MNALPVIAVLLLLALAAAVLIPATRRAALALAPWAAAPALAAALWPAPPLEAPQWLTGLRFGLDDTGRTFLLFTSLLWLAAGWAARAYHADDARRHTLWAFWLAALAGNVWLIVALDAAGFYAGFALMTFAGYGLLVHTGSGAARHAGRVYLVLAVLGEAALLAGLLPAAAVGTTLLMVRFLLALAAQEAAPKRGTAAPWLAAVALALALAWLVAPTPLQADALSAALPVAIGVALAAAVAWRRPFVPDAPPRLPAGDLLSATAPAAQALWRGVLGLAGAPERLGLRPCSGLGNGAIVRLEARARRFASVGAALLVLLVGLAFALAH